MTDTNSELINSNDSIKEDKTTILLVDDEENNLNVLESALDYPDLKLVQAQSGKEALRFLLEQDCAAILLDVMMPFMSGFETAQMLRARPRSAGIPIIFLTAHHDSQNEIFQGYDLGAVDYIIKPFHPRILRAKVRVFVDLYKKTKALEHEAQLAQHRTHHDLVMGREETEDVSRQWVDSTILGQLAPEYQRLLQAYILAMRSEEKLPVEQIKLFAGQLLRKQFRAKDVMRLHLKVWDSFAERLLPQDRQDLANDSRLVLLDLIGNLANLYLEFIWANEPSKASETIQSSA